MTTIELRPLDEAGLAELCETAYSDADPTEVMPPVDGPPGWTGQARAAFTAFHNTVREDPAKSVYAILVDGRAAGTIRLDRVGGEPETVLETGYWVARSARGKGVATEAVRLVLAEAARRGAATVRADTTVGNTGSRKALERNGASCTVDPGGTDVRAVFDLSARLSSADG